MTNPNLISDTVLQKSKQTNFQTVFFLFKKNAIKIAPTDLSKKCSQQKLGQLLQTFEI